MRFRTSYANITSTLALVVAMSGASYAAVTIPKNSIGSPQVKNDSLVGADINESKLGAVPNAKKLAGKDLSAVRYPSVLPSGTTLTGIWNIDADTSGSGDWRTDISFPAPTATEVAVEINLDTPTANCPGTVASPTATPGYLCIYIYGHGGYASIIAFPGVGNRGALVSASDDGSAGDLFANGTWALVAP
jgi:hypothetical protein